MAALLNNLLIHNHIKRAVPRKKKWADQMFIRNREKNILELLLKMSGTHTVSSLASTLHVSERTVNRDMRNIEKILSEYNLKISRNKDNFLYIKGKNEDIFKLSQGLSRMRPLDFSVDQRKLIVLIKLLQAKEPIKQHALISDLDISAATIASYLDDLQAFVKGFGLVLIRKRNFGIQLSGNEASKRKALGKFFIQHFHEELIEALFQLDHHRFRYTDSLFLHYFKPAYLNVVQNAVNTELEEKKIDLADSDYMAFILQVYITYQRYSKGYRLQDVDHHSDLEESDIAFVQSVCHRIENEIKNEISELEKQYLAEYFKGSKVQSAESVYDDNVITSRNIKHLIELVSQKINVDLTSDFSLFQGLLAHLKPSIFRIRKNLGSYNPLTEQIKQQYPKLFKVITDVTQRVFKDLSFPDDEIAYIVLHFGASLEQRQSNINLHALVVCPTGIGASKMLETRLRKEIPCITNIEISSIKEMKTKDLDQYDLVFSTVRLPWAKHTYIYVNPLLSKEDVKNIEGYINSYIHSDQKDFREKNVKPIETDFLSGPKTLDNLMDDVKYMYSSISTLLRNLKVYTGLNGEDYRGIIRLMVESCFQQDIIKNVDSIYRRLLEREKIAGLGIPGTNMALFHCQDQGVKKLAFQLGHLDTPFILRGMDEKPMSVRNILLLLAPEELTPIQREIMSLVSSTIIEDNKSILIFSSANEHLIREKLEKSFYQFIKNKILEE
ncbi:MULTISPECIES: BglG family transcription antiterminator [Heyndrickxia]|uniref:BglG family transcription antiterminator n=3 Tax=Bacillaceae TaxID=186817 RepID=UPI0023E3A8E6|nr:BglG family transcription antiterminator [Heyndrickxia coagulans]